MHALRHYVIKIFCPNAARNACISEEPVSDRTSLQRKVMEILDQLVDRSPTERIQGIEELCQHDPELQRAVLACLPYLGADESEGHSGEQK